MRKRCVLVGLLVLAVVGLLTGCGGGAVATEIVAPEDVPVVTDGDDTVVAEAVIEPVRWSELHFSTGGDVVEVLVQEGDVVAEGDLLLRLDTTDLERAVARAELDLRQAELGLERLQEPVDEVDIRQAEHAVDQADAALTVAQMNSGTVWNSRLLNETREDAQELYDDRLHRYDVRVAMYESGEEPDYWFVDQAKEQLDDARLNLDRIRQQGGVQSQDARNEVARTEQALLEAQDDLAQLLKPVDPKDVEAAQLDIEAAELALQEARDSLEDTTLYALFSGTVTRLEVDVGETISAGEVVVLLATLDQLQARTVDLTELDVARVAVGQPVVVTVDALPEDEFEGQVARIDLQAVDYRGDVTYPVYVELDEGTPELYWGMTAMVEIEAQ